MKAIILAMIAVMSIIGFMIKLPKVFIGYDKELHFLFYFCAILILSSVLAKQKYLYHLWICAMLFCFGVFIECMQEVSNQFVTRKIHGNFDPEDVAYNLQGIIYASLLWSVYTIVKIIIDKRK